MQYYRNLVSAAALPGVGLEIGLKTRLADFGSSGYSIMTAATAEVAIRKGHEHYDLHYLHVDWKTEFSKTTIIHSLLIDPSLSDLRLFLTERALTVLQANAEELIGPDCHPDTLLLDYPDPGYGERYREIFKCAVYFDSGVTEVHYPASYLDFEIPTYDPEVHEVLEAVTATLSQKLSPDIDIVTSIRLAIREKAGTFPSIEVIAQQLNMSSRTLSRQLRNSGTNFQRLLDDARREVAEDQLLHSQMSIQQIAESCGFRDAQNFSQAFKRWKGMSPSEFRKSCGTTAP